MGVFLFNYKKYMFKPTLEFLEFFLETIPFLFSLIVLTILAIALSKSIKKHSKIYNWIFGTICLSFTIPVIFKAFGIFIPSIMMIPILGTIAAELSSATYFLHPVLVIIMFMGAFSPKHKYIGRLMTIRKELSILVGFPFFAHIAKRLFHTFPGSWNFFMNYEESIASPRVTSVAGSTIENAIFVLGVVMTVFFLVLWITSFASIKRKMGGKKWKSLQRWSYGLYAMLFIHSVGLQLGELMSYNAAQEKITTVAAKTELVAESKQAQDRHSQKAAPAKSSGHGHGHGPKRFSFSDIDVPRDTKAKMNIFIYFLVYGSYLYFRLKKAKTDRLKRTSKS